MLRFVSQDLDNCVTEEFNFGHGLVENVIKIVEKRVAERRGEDEEYCEKKKVQHQMTALKADISGLRETIEQLKTSRTK